MNRYQATFKNGTDATSFRAADDMAAVNFALTTLNGQMVKAIFREVEDEKLECIWEAQAVGDVVDGKIHTTPVTREELIELSGKTPEQFDKDAREQIAFYLRMLRPITPEEIEAQRAGMSHYTPGTRQAFPFTEAMMGNYAEKTPFQAYRGKVLVVTHVNSHGRVETQVALAHDTDLNLYMRDNYRDFCRNAGEDIWVCCLDYIVTKILEIK